MTAIDQDYQFELDGFVFGLRTDLPTKDAGFDPGSADWRTQDSDASSGDSRSFGRDYLSAPTWSWTCFTNREDAAEALDTLRALATVWRNEDGRRVPGAVLPLRYMLNNRVRRVYGRPRRLAYPPDNMILNGRVDTAFTFDCADHLHYDDVESSITITTSPASLGGFPVPGTVPWASVSTPQARTSAMHVTGDAATYPVITFQASTEATCGNPKVVIGDVTYGLDAVIPIGGSITIDTAPWAMTVLNDSGANKSGLLTPETRIDLATLKPGDYVAAFSCVDISGGATCTVSWRNAHNAL